MSNLGTRQTGNKIRKVARLTAADRCDRCPATAQGVADTPWGELLFCGHHLTKYEVALIAQGSVIYRK